MVTEGFEIGMDVGKDETVVYSEGGCQQCHRQWPHVKFAKLAAVIPQYGGQMDRAEIICDTCWPVDDLAAKIDEAQIGPDVSILLRVVNVMGVQSGTKVVGFQFATHRGAKALTVTELHVDFEGGKRYIYQNVPVAVCEAWYAAPSQGEYFIEFIKTSYSCEKVK